MKISPVRVITLCSRRPFLAASILIRHENVFPRGQDLGSWQLAALKSSDGSQRTPDLGCSISRFSARLSFGGLSTRYRKFPIDEQVYISRLAKRRRKEERERASKKAYCFAPLSGSCSVDKYTTTPWVRPLGGSRTTARA